MSEYVEHGYKIDTLISKESSYNENVVWFIL